MITTFIIITQTKNTTLGRLINRQFISKSDHQAKIIQIGRTQYYEKFYLFSQGEYVQPFKNE